MSHIAVVVSDFGGDAARTVESLRAAAARAGAETEIVAVGHGGQPQCTADRTVEALPLGSAYVRNRGLALTDAPLVAFVDGGLVVDDEWAAALLTELTGGASAVAGPVSTASRRWPRLRGSRTLLSPVWWTGTANAAFSREQLAALGGFSHDRARGGDAEIFLRLLRTGRALGWSPRLAARGVGGDRVAPASPKALLARLPADLRRVLPVEPTPLSRSHPAKMRFSYAVGPDLILHLHGNPSSRLERAVREREAIRRNASVGGIPRLVATATAADAAWLLEERLPGLPPPSGPADAWFDAAAEWAVGMAGDPGRPLSEVPTWREHGRAVVEFAPPAAGEQIGRALDAISSLRTVHMHGDLQPRNLLLDRGAVGAVDWEGAWLEGVPGLDLVFLALFADGAGPDVTVLERLARGDDTPRRPLLPRLRRLGIEPDVLRDLLVVLLAVWALSEHRRLTRLGAPPQPPVFFPLLQRFLA